MIWGTFTSFDYMLLVTDELVDEILALGDKVEITFPEKLRMKLLQKIDVSETGMQHKNLQL